MPITINGIGNAYHGKQNPLTIQGVCEFCHAAGPLTSYDTTNFFVILYIPIIPLGKLRVLNSCVYCNRFRCISLSQWEAGKKQSIDEMKKLLESDDDSKEPVLQALSVAIAYQDITLLDTIANNLAKEMTDDAEVQALLGDAYVYFGRLGDGAEAYRNVMEVAPTPAVSDQLALTYMRLEDRDKALPLVEQALASKDINRVWVAEVLVHGLIGRKEFDQAQKWLDKIASAVPEFVGTRRWNDLNRLAKRASKKANGEGAFSKIARLPWRWIATASVLCVAMGAMIGLPIYRQSHQRVILVNSLKTPYLVTVGGQVYSLQPGMRKEITLGAGSWPVNPSGNKLDLQSFQLEIDPPFFSGLFYPPTFLVNPDRMGVFVHEKVFYAANKNEAPEGEFHWLIGKPTYQVDWVDHLFESMPEAIQVQGKNAQSRTRLGQEMVSNDDLQMLLGITSEAGVDVFDYLELRNDRLGDNDLLLRFLLKSEPADRFLAYVKKRLDQTPLRIPIHRAYQDVMRNEGHAEQVFEEYLKRREAHPNAIDTAYLLARVTPDGRERELLWEFLSQNRNLPNYAILGYASMLWSKGEFEKAASFCSRIKNESELDTISQLQCVAIYESGQKWDSMIRICNMVRGPFLDAALQYEIRAVHGKSGSKGTPPYIDRLINGLPQRRGEYVATGVRDPIEPVLKAYAAYANKNFAQFEKQIKGTPAFDLFEWDMIQGNFQPYLGEQKREVRSWEKFAILAIAAHQKKDIPARESFFEQCVAAFQKDDFQEQRLAELLQIDDLSDLKRITRSSSTPQDKRLIVTLLAIRAPQPSAELIVLAKVYNYEKSPPYWLIDSVLSDASKALNAE